MIFGGVQASAGERPANDGLVYERRTIRARTGTRPASRLLGDLQTAAGPRRPARRQERLNGSTTGGISMWGGASSRGGEVHRS